MTVSINNKCLAIHGGEPIRKIKMPPRFAFSEDEFSMMMSVVEYYKSREEDPPYEGYFEKKFCEGFTQFMGGGYADAVATGTASVYVALAALDLPPQSEVIISPVTDSGPLNCIILQRFIPVVADSKPDSYNMGVKEFFDRITPRTSALLAVHCGGEPLEIDRIVEEAHKRGIKVLEDCSQAPGAKWENKKVGTFGDISAFSTMYRKTLTSGASGGLVYTKDIDLFRKGLGHADRGKPVWRNDIDLRNPGHALFPALNFNTDEFSCAIGLSSLNRLQNAVDKRVSFISQLVDIVKSNSKVCTPYNFHKGFSPFFFPVFVDIDKLKCSKIEFAEAVAAEGIGLGTHYGCVITSWKWAQPYLSDDFITKNALSTRDRSFNLYVNERYGEQELKDIINAILKVENFYLK